jgi:hypothetical protein
VIHKTTKDIDELSDIWAGEIIFTTPHTILPSSAVTCGEKSYAYLPDALCAERGIAVPPHLIGYALPSERKGKD